MAQACLLPDRAVLQIGGAEAQGFLQNLLSNNLDLISPERAIYALLLTPQGKYLFDFFLVEKDGAYLVDCDRKAAPEFLKRLTFYKLRADVSLKDLSQDWAVGVVFEDNAQTETRQTGAATPFLEGVRFQDPRLGDLGARFLVPNDSADAAVREAGTACDPADYNRLRLSLAIPGADDLIADKTFPLEANLDLLNAVDYQKGCFVGQEVTSRTHRQGKVRKRILCVTGAASLPHTDSPVMAGDKQAGVLLSSSGDIGLALLRLDRLEQTLDVNGTALKAHFPDWLTQALPEDERP